MQDIKGIYQIHAIYYVDFKLLQLRVANISLAALPVAYSIKGYQDLFNLLWSIDILRPIKHFFYASLP